ncbi:MAG TPA: winged helix DNA-binding domain-containing protein [Ktedonobacterales bacterium]|nr:winged helix DNA-binding domain-containing protein [Ktedonobacterales bacterium]
MHALTWRQVHARRLAQHGLSPRWNAPEAAQAATRTGGIQAQVMSAAELALCARVAGLAPHDVRAALWQDRSLVKTWAMRGTLHLLAVSDLPLYVAARDFRTDSRAWANYFAYYGLTPEQQHAFFAAVPQVLGRDPMTRQQLAEALARHTGIAHLGDFILSSSWGSPLKPSAFRGDLCFGPNQGQQVTFVNPRAWFGDWEAIGPQVALQEIARRYLQAYGPATPDDFARWWGGGGQKVTARKLFQSLHDELDEVDVEGWRAFALRESLAAMQQLDPAETAIHLLPLFDAYTIGAPRDQEALLASAHKGRVFRQQGWISAVVLVNGSIQGVWSHSARRAQTTVKVQLFSAPSAAVRKGIESEVERLAGLFKTSVVVEYE